MFTQTAVPPITINYGFDVISSLDHMWSSHELGKLVNRAESRKDKTTYRIDCKVHQKFTNYQNKAKSRNLETI